LLQRNAIGPDIVVAYNKVKKSMKKDWKSKIRSIRNFKVFKEKS